MAKRRQPLRRRIWWERLPIAQHASGQLCAQVPGRSAYERGSDSDDGAPFGAVQPGPFASGGAPSFPGGGQPPLPRSGVPPVAPGGYRDAPPSPDAEPGRSSASGATSGGDRGGCGGGSEQLGQLQSREGGGAAAADGESGAGGPAGGGGRGGGTSRRTSEDKKRVRFAAYVPPQRRSSTDAAPQQLMQVRRVVLEVRTGSRRCRASFPGPVSTTSYCYKCCPCWFVQCFTGADAGPGRQQFLRG